MTEEEEKRKFDRMKRVVVATFEVVNTVLKKHVLSSKMPWYDTTETQEELRVGKVWFTNQQNYYTGDLFAKCGDYYYHIAQAPIMAATNLLAPVFFSQLIL